MTRSRILALSCALAGAALFFPADVQAQHRRAVRVIPSRSVVVVGAGFYRPFFYDPWYGWGAPYYGWYPPYYGYPPYGYPYGYYGSASLRLQVEPKETEVFIDGYFAGTVDDFDGFFQRLHLEPGEHELELYLPNHRSAKQKIYLQPNATFRVKHDMQPIAAGETPDPRPVPAPGAPPRGGYGAPAGRNQPGPDGPAGSQPPDRSSNFGTLAVRVQPARAEVIVDGESWNGPEGAERLMIQLPEGEHRVEVRREGYAGYSSTVRVRRGETATLNVSLVRE